MTFSQVMVRTYVHATESEDKVRAALATVAGPAAKVAVQRSEGFHGNPITILDAIITEKAEIAEFWSRLKSKLPEILELLEARIDDHNTLHLRFDKQRAYSGSLVLATHDDIITARAKIISYPATHQAAVAAARKYLTEI